MGQYDSRLLRRRSSGRLFRRGAASSAGSTRSARRSSAGRGGRSLGKRLGALFIKGSARRYEINVRFLACLGRVGPDLDTARVDALFLGQVRLGVTCAFLGQAVTGTLLRIVVA